LVILFVTRDKLHAQATNLAIIHVDDEVKHRHFCQGKTYLLLNSTKGEEIVKQLELNGIPSQLQHLFNIDMKYEPGNSNIETGKRRVECTIKYAARFGLVSPTFISWLYDINRALALEHLGKLVKLGLLEVASSVRAVDGRVYVLTYHGAKHAEQLLQQYIPFRSTTDPVARINQNSLMHDCILQSVLGAGVQQGVAQGQPVQQWTGFVSELEFKRIYPQNNIRNVDGLIIEPNGNVCAIEVEHSYKPIQIRKTILLKYLYSLKNGFYDKVFFVSQSLQILNDMKRINQQALDNLENTFDKKANRPLLNQNERRFLEEKLVYRTKFCEQIQKLFYR